VTQKDALDKGRAAKDSAVDEITHPMAEDLFQWQFAATRHFGFHFPGGISNNQPVPWNSQPQYHVPQGQADPSET
jgi:hypothetical protein